VTDSNITQRTSMQEMRACWLTWHDPEPAGGGGGEDLRSRKWCSIKMLYNETHFAVHQRETASLITAPG
jgi:hypothetical protein